MKQIIVCAFILGFISACAPEVGSEKWCQQMKEKSAGDWTTNEAKDYTKHCLFNDDQE